MQQPEASHALTQKKYNRISLFPGLLSDFSPGTFYTN